MGVGFYSKIRSGVSSDSAGVNDIYQKLKEGIVGFSISDVLEDRIRSLIETISITEVFRIHTITLNSDTNAEVTETAFISFLRRVAVRLLPSTDNDLVSQTIPSGGDVTYTGQTILLPNFGNIPNTSTNEKFTQNLWLVVKGAFSIVSDSNNIIADTDFTTAQYDPTDNSFHVLQVVYEGTSGTSVVVTIDTGSAITLSGKPSNITVGKSTQFTGEFRAIWCSVLDSTGVDGNTITKVINNNYDLTNVEFGLFGTGGIICSSRLPMFLA